MDVVVSGGVRISYDRVGAGPPVVLSGGLGMPPGVWDFCGLRDALVGAGFEVVTYSARGVAPSDAPPAPYAVADLAGDLAGLMDALGVTGATVVGYSLGSLTTELLARTRPDLVRSLVLLAGAGPLSGVLEATLRAEEELIALTGGIPPAYATLTVLTSLLPPDTLTQDDARLREWLALLGEPSDVWTSADGEIGQTAAARDWMRDGDRMAALAEIRVPALVLAFEHDTYFPPAGGEAAAALLPQGEFVRVAGGAHGGLLTHAKATVEQIVGFVSRTGAA
ncbi:alpha/beta fold hydrolase [Yinghuangia seranimata]|uniref:alpha/beta fold hydrolase n=1 Tax=Yinghuangia seranimata TaxID=408067 RepID=UPI00248C79FF|nr:alpha/beta hydrolase [Yinghuangia seranimata]MDI2127839.1 alpha/beta hydrolase [Yinghuangia seranimata]